MSEGASTNGPSGLEGWRQRLREGGLGKFDAWMDAELLGVSRAPLYTSENAPARGSEGRPRAAPFVRGVGAAPSGVGLPWCAVSRVAAPSPEAANTELLAELQGGAEGIWLVLDASVRSGGAQPIAGDGLLLTCADDLQRSLSGVLLDGIELDFDAGLAAPLLRPMLQRLVESTGLDAASLRVHTGQDRYEPSLEFGCGGSAQVGEPNPFGGSGRTVSALHLGLAGAGDVDLLAYVLANLAQGLRDVEAAGGSAEDAFHATQVRIPVETDLLGGAVQLRALRGLLSAFAAACGFVQRPLRVHAVTSERSLAAIDPWSNLLRGTYQALGAILGGADALTIRPFDTARGRGSAQARGIARNVHHVLAREAHLGRVLDPLGGSYTVEQRTAELERAAWARFRELEAAGGLEALLAPGALEAWIAPAQALRRVPLRRRAAPLLGVTQHVQLDPKPAPAADAPADNVGQALPAALASQLESGLSAQPREPLVPDRDTAEFEALRTVSDAQPTRPRVFLANLGRLRDHRARSLFAADTFAIAGIDSVHGEGTPAVTGMAAAMLIADQFEAAGTPVACICGSDADYAEHAEALVGALARAGARQVWIASPETEPLQALADSGLSGFVHRGVDVIELLGPVQAQLIGAALEGASR